MTRPVAWERAAGAALLIVAAVLYALHFVHLGADFPNGSPWMDWAKYTDEGWYGDAAIRFYLRGNWRVAGDFNPGAALPVWPLMEAVVFRFAGVSIVAARALAVAVLGGIAAGTYWLLCVPFTPGRPSVWQQRLAAAVAATLLCASPFVFAFSRMAILEPLLIFWMLCALLVAYSLGSVASERSRTLRLIVLGVLVALMIGTKTTAIFLLPSLAWALWSAAEWRPRLMARDTAIVGAAAALPIATYLLVLRHAGLLVDAHYLFAANADVSITRDTFWTVVWQTLQGGTAMGAGLYLSAAIIVLCSLLYRALRRDFVFVSLLLWAAGYLTYIAYHASFQPRYYLVVAVPVLLLLCRGGAAVAERWAPALAILAPLAAWMLVHSGYQTLRYVRHPEYTFQRAAKAVGDVVMSEPLHSHTVLSISGSTLSLMTGLPSICDDFGTMDLEDRIATYKPGWFVTWNYVEDDKMEALSRWYRLTRKAAIPAMDDPERNLMIVYRLDALHGANPRRRARRNH